MGILRGLKERTTGEHDQLPLDGGSDPLDCVLISETCLRDQQLRVSETQTRPGGYEEEMEWGMGRAVPQVPNLGLSL